MKAAFLLENDYLTKKKIDALQHVFDNTELEVELLIYNGDKVD